MEKQKRMRATSPARWIVGAVLMIVLFAIFFLDIVTLDTKARIAIIICAVVFVPGVVWNLIHIRYLTPEGVECCRFGKVICRVPWKQTAQVCIARESKNTSITMLVITPVGCEAFNSKKWSGRDYAFRFRKQVITIDNTMKNRQFIETYYGEIADMRNS